MHVPNLHSYHFLAAIAFLLAFSFGCTQPHSANSELAAKVLDLESRIAGVQADSQINQQEKVQALVKIEEELAELLSDTLPIKGVIDLMEALKEQNQIEEARQFGRQVFARAQELQDSLSQAHILHFGGDMFMRIRKYDSAYYAYSLAHSRFMIRDSLRMGAFMKYRMGVADYYSQDYLSADANAAEAIKLYDQIDAPESIEELSLCYTLLGSISYSIGQWEQALENHQKALELLEGNPKFEDRTFRVYNNISTVLIDMKEPDLALGYLNRILDQSNLTQNNPQTYAIALMNAGRAELGLGELDKAEQHFRAAIPFFESISQLRSRQPRNYYYMADLDWARGDSLAAQNHIALARKLAEEMQETDGLQDILVLQGTITPELAESNMRSLDQLRDSLILVERLNRNKKARIELQTDQYIAENENLARQRLLWISVAAGVLLLGAAILIIINQQVRNQKLRFQQQQQEANQEIFNLMLSQSEKVEEGKHEVQKRISEDLHDAILGEMNGIRMVLLGLNAKSDEQSQELRGQAIEKLKTVQEEIRTISHELSDSAYRKFHNFILSIEDLVSSYCDSANLLYRLEYDKEIDWDGLSGVIKINLYRIIQECLQNIIKHAQASQVEVSLAPQGHQFEVTIRDNGVGFQPKRGKKGIGHKNIQSRVDKIQGDWTLKSAPGKGTQVTLYIPHHDLTSLGTHEKGVVKV